MKGLTATKMEDSAENRLTVEMWVKAQDRFFLALEELQKLNLMLDAPMAKKSFLRVARRELMELESKA